MEKELPRSVEVAIEQQPDESGFADDRDRNPAQNSYLPGVLIVSLDCAGALDEIDAPRAVELELNWLIQPIDDDLARETGWIRRFASLYRISIALHVTATKKQQSADIPQ